VLHLPRAARSGYHNVAGGAACRALWISVGYYSSRAAHTVASVILAEFEIEEAMYTRESRPKSPHPFYSTGCGSNVGEDTFRASGDRVSALGRLSFTHAYGTKQPPRSRSRSMSFYEPNKIN
jgi:hypothetical protein